MKKSLSINAILNIIKTSLGMLFPLITFPYVSRILLVENIGKVNYAASVVGYFSLIAALGIQVYAIREGSRLRGNKEKLNKFISEVFSINVITSIVAFSILASLNLFTDLFIGYTNLIWILSLTIPLTLIGSDWINSIFEDYLYITIRTIAFQLIALLLIFLLVKEKNDYPLYAFCTVVSGAGPGIVNYFYTKRYAKKRFLIKNNFIKHIKPIFILFSASLASMIYSSSDTIMLGIMVNDYSVGIYSTASKVYNIFKGLLFAIVVVSLPRFSYMFANESKEKYENITSKVSGIMVLISIPLVAGIITLSENIVNLLAGDEYSDAITTLKIKSVAILFAIFAYFFMQLILLPAKKDTLIMKATIFGGIINIILNLVLIPNFHENGAAFTTVISEALVGVIVIYFGKKIVNIKISIKNILQIILSTIIMVIFILLVVNVIGNDILSIVTSFIAGSIIYFLTLFILKNKYMIEFKRNFMFKIRGLKSN